MLLDKRIPLNYLFNKIKYQLVYVFILSIIIVFLTHKYEDLLPGMPLTIPAFIGTTISILLSFKLNQSYDRWWEARKIWGSVVNDSRSFVIQLQSMIGSGHKEAIRKIAYRQIAWCHSLGQSLRNKDAEAGISKFLSEEDMTYIRSHQNKPLALLSLHAENLKELRDKNIIDIFSHIHIDKTLVRLCESQGKAERIKTTVFPVTYRMLLHFIIYLFIVTLSVSLENVAGYFEVPLLLVISSAFFFLEKTAVHMQDPFDNRPTDTAVTAIAKTIEMNIKHLLGEDADIQPINNEFFYLN